jgi:hypothetical protein
MFMVSLGKRKYLPMISLSFQFFCSNILELLVLIFAWISWAKTGKYSCPHHRCHPGLQSVLVVHSDVYSFFTLPALDWYGDGESKALPVHLFQVFSPKTENNAGYFSFSRCLRKLAMMCGLVMWGLLDNLTGSTRIDFALVLP